MAKCTKKGNLFFDPFIARFSPGKKQKNPWPKRVGRTRRKDDKTVRSNPEALPVKRDRKKKVASLNPFGWSLVSTEKVIRTLANTREKENVEQSTVPILKSGVA